MRKEVITAIFFGIIFGLLIAFGLYRANTAMSPQKVANESTNEIDNETQAVTQDTSESTLSIAKPQNNEVLTESSVVVSGITQSNSHVAVSSENSDYLITTDENGEFVQEIELIAGPNQIIITSQNPEGIINSATLTLIYSSQIEPEIITNNEGDEGSTESADSVREKVQEKIQQVLSKNRAYLGSVTDIVEDTVQITDDQGEIKQISVGGDTTFADITTEDQEAVEAEDVAIGDYIIAMGKVDESKVLNAQRILVSEMLEEPLRKVYFTTVETLEGRSLSFTVNDDVVETVFPRRWKGPEIDELSEGDRVLIVTVPEDGEPTIRTILLLDETSNKNE